jgi:hypothetical protein
MSELLIIAKGDWLTCENGHRFAQAMRNISPGDVMKSSNFYFSDGVQPSPGSEVQPCSICGAARVKMGESGFIPFIERLS